MVSNIFFSYPWCILRSYKLKKTNTVKKIQPRVTNVVIESGLSYLVKGFLSLYDEYSYPQGPKQKSRQVKECGYIILNDLL